MYLVFLKDLISLVQKATPHEVEQRLEELLPKEEWIHTHHAMILFGRYTMPARTKNQDPYSFYHH